MSGHGVPNAISFVIKQGTPQGACARTMAIGSRSPQALWRFLFLAAFLETRVETELKVFKSSCSSAAPGLCVLGPR